MPSPALVSCDNVPVCRKVLYLFLSVVGWGGALAANVALFIEFNDCPLSRFFVSFTLIWGVIGTVISRM